MMIHRCELIRRLVGAGATPPNENNVRLAGSKGQSRALPLREDNHFVSPCHPCSIPVNLHLPANIE